MGVCHSRHKPNSSANCSEARRRWHVARKHVINYLYMRRRWSRLGRELQGLKGLGEHLEVKNGVLGYKTPPVQQLVQNKMYANIGLWLSRRKSSDIRQRGVARRWWGIARRRVWRYLYMKREWNRLKQVLQQQHWKTLGQHIERKKGVLHYKSHEKK